MSLTDIQHERDGSAAGILNAVRVVLDNEGETLEHRVRRAGALLRNLQAPHSASNFAPGGLLAWHVRRVRDYIQAHIAESIHIEDMCGQVGLSASHFCRAFRISQKVSPHHYLMQRRVEHAQALMLTTRLPLIRIAADCGLADQAHLSKVFRKLTGETPTAWRRARVAALAMHG